MADQKPPPLRWFIGIELARYREEARLSMTKAGALSELTKSKIAHLETGRQLQSAEDIRRLLSAYGADSRSIARLTALAGREDEANWWRPWSDVVPPWFSIYVGLERIADRSFWYEPNVIPAVLQTKEYATALTSDSLLVRADRAQRVVDFRMQRSARITGQADPLWVHAVISSRVLDLAVGTPEVREAQLMHLAKMADLPTVTVQVLHPEAGVVSMTNGGGFVLLTFDAVSQIGYTELIDDAVYLYDPLKLRTYETAAGELQRAAYDPERSLAEIRSRIIR